MSRALGLKHLSDRNRPFFERLSFWFKREHSLDSMMIVIAVLYPLTIIPQAIKLIQIEDASSISLMSFILKALFTLPWLLYGIKHQSKPVIVSNLLWFLGYLVIIAETLVY